MNISHFKEGDIITRVAPCQYANGGIKDGSYLGARITFLGCEKKIVFFQLPDSFGDEVLTLSFGRDPWDEGWDYYPESLWTRLVKRYQKSKVE